MGPTGESRIDWDEGAGAITFAYEFYFPATELSLASLISFPLYLQAL